MNDEKLVDWIAWNMEFFGPSRMGRAAREKPEEFLQAAVRRPEFASEALRFLSGEAAEAVLEYLLSEGQFSDAKNAAKVRPDLAPRIQEQVVGGLYRRMRPSAHELKSWIREVKGVDTRPVQGLFAEQAYLRELVDFQCEAGSPADATTTVQVLFEKGEDGWTVGLCRSLPEAARTLQAILEAMVEQDKILTSRVATFVRGVPGMDPTRMEEMLIARDSRVVSSYVQQSGRTEGPAVDLAAAVHVLDQ